MALNTTIVPETPRIFGGNRTITRTVLCGLFDTARTKIHSKFKLKIRHNVYTYQQMYAFCLESKNLKKTAEEIL